MRTVEIPEQIYAAASEAAADEGFPSVDEYVTSVMARELLPDGNLDHLFTPAVIASLDRAAAQLDRGESVTLDKYQSRWPQRREELLRRLKP